MSLRNEKLPTVKIEKKNKITKNGKKCAGREFNNVQNSSKNEIVFVANTKSNRQMKGVNTVIKKKKSTVKKTTTTKKTIDTWSEINSI